MARTIVKLRDYYFEYSSVVDAPVTWGMKKKDFEAYYREEYGRSSLEDFQDRMKRVDKNGTSSVSGSSVEEVLDGNCAGPNGKELTVEEIYKFYCLHEPFSK